MNMSQSNLASDREFLLELLDKSFTNADFELFVFTQFPLIQKNSAGKARDKLSIEIVEYCEVYSLNLSDLVRVKNPTKFQEIWNRWSKSRQTSPPQPSEKSPSGPHKEIQIVTKPTPLALETQEASGEYTVPPKPTSTYHVSIDTNKVIQISADPHTSEEQQHIYQIELAESEQMFYNERLVMARAKRSAVSYIEQSRKRLVTKGKELYECVFNQAGTDWDRIMFEQEGCYLLNLDASLWHIPWELMFRDKYGYLDRGAFEPVVRFLALPTTLPKTIYIDSPRICFITTDPINKPTRAQEQFDKLVTQLPGEPHDSIIRRIDISLAGKTFFWEHVCEELRRTRPNVLHIVAHGTGPEGLIMEGATRDEEVVVEYQALVDILVEIRSVQILVIAACESGSFFVNYPDLAKKLFISSGLLAAILMDSEISAPALIKFTEHFYRALWHGLELSSALGVARSALRAIKTDPSSLQWSVPIMYRVNDSAILISGLYEEVHKPFLPIEYVEQTRTIAKAVQSDVHRLCYLFEKPRPPIEDIQEAGEQLSREFENFLTELKQLEAYPHNQMDENWLKKLMHKVSWLEGDITRFAQFSIKYGQGKHNYSPSGLMQKALSATYNFMELFDEYTYS